MGGVALKLPTIRRPAIKLPDLPRPTRWDWAAIAVLTLGVVLAIANIVLSRTKPEAEPFSPGLTALFVLAQLGVSLGGLLLLGKTAKEGTGWGNLAAVGASFLGMGGVLLAAAMWALA
jgi:hypothetical protein